MKVLGVDEVGRGALAGPLVACAVLVMDENFFSFANIVDSKLLSDLERRALAPIIQNYCRWSYAVVSNRVIDRIGIQAANVLAFDLTLRVFSKDIPVRADYVGGFKQYTSSSRNITLHTRGESQFPEIAAASILAKVFRDDLMLELHRRYPAYAFDQHKGYGTELHRALIRKYGVLGMHRRSFNLSSR